MAFEPPPPPPDVFARLVPAAAPDQELKAGFRFEPNAYAELKTLKLEADTTLFAAPRCARRYLKWTSAATELHIAVSVNCTSVAAARQEFVTYILRSSMLPPNTYVAGPAGFGDFCVVYGYEATAGKIERLIHFMRGNVGVTVRRPRGTLSVTDLARQIDQRLTARDTVRDLASWCPQGLTGTLSRQEVQVGETVEFALTFERKQGENYQIFVLTDHRLLKERSLRDGQAVWLAMAPGVAPVQATVCDTNLLCSSLETAVKILENE